MAQDAITITGIEQYQEALRKMQTDNPATKKELQAIIQRAIREARKNIVKDAQDILENDPRNAYKAVRSSVYRSIFGGQVNIISSRRRGAPTKYQRPRKLDQDPHQQPTPSQQRNAEIPELRRNRPWIYPPIPECRHRGT